MKHPIPRRIFLRRSTLSVGTLLLVHPRLAFAASANSKLNVAAIGAGGQGRGNIDNVAGLGQNIVALCDVDHKHAADTFRKYPQAKVYKDFRRMFDEMAKGIDAVIVSTPDHTHAVAAVAAMLRGKHVYCEKPLTRTVQEARAMRETALRTHVVTQMGNQGSASSGLRRAVEIAWGGMLGEIREAHVWFDGGNGPLNRPSDTPPIPETLDWDLWLGPAAYRPYHPSYLPGAWRGWRAFGSGIVGDFGCHTANIMFRALHLEQLWKIEKGTRSKHPVIRVEAKPSEVNAEGYPKAMRVELAFPARGDVPAARLTLYAQHKPADELLLGWPMSKWGDLLVGSKGSLLSECPWNTRYVLLPENRFPDNKGSAPQVLPRTDSHHREWIEACQGKGRTFSPFEVGGPLTEILQLANLATLVEGRLDYDTVAGRILNHARANELLHRQYRKGWKL